MADGFNKSTDTAKYVTSSENWKNLYNPAQRSFFATGVDTGFTGFFQPKFLNETWAIQDPLWCSTIDQDAGVTHQCSLTNNAVETFESSIWEYGLYVLTAARLAEIVADESIASCHTTRVIS